MHMSKNFIVLYIHGIKLWSLRLDCTYVSELGSGYLHRIWAVFLLLGWCGSWWIHAEDSHLQAFLLKFCRGAVYVEFASSLWVYVKFLLPGLIVYMTWFMECHPAKAFWCLIVSSFWGLILHKHKCMITINIDFNNNTFIHPSSFQLHVLSKLTENPKAIGWGAGWKAETPWMRWQSLTKNIQNMLWTIVDNL